MKAAERGTDRPSRLIPLAFGWLAVFLCGVVFPRPVLGSSMQESSDQLALQMLSILSNYRAGNVQEAALAWQHLAQDTLLVAKENQKDVRRLAGVAFVLSSFAWHQLADARAFYVWQAALETLLEQGLVWEDLVAEQLARLGAISRALVSADLVSDVLPSTPVKLDAEGLLWSELEKRIAISTYLGPENLQATPNQIDQELSLTGRSPAPIPLDNAPDGPSTQIEEGLPGTEVFGEGISQERGFRESSRVTPNLETETSSNVEADSSKQEEESPYSQTSPAFLEAIEEEFGNEGEPGIVETTVGEGELPEELSRFESETAVPIEPSTTPLVEALEEAPADVPVMMRDLFQVAPYGEIEYVEPTWRASLDQQRALTKSQIKSAQTAWAYVARNTQPQTGLVNSVEGYPFATMWDLASGLASLLCAGELGLIPTQEFETRIDSMLVTLESLRLYRDVLPNREYKTSNGQMTDLKNQESMVGSGWSAIDLGRMLVWMAICREWIPRQARRVDAIVRGWNLEAACQRGQLFGAFHDGETEVLRQEGRLGYEQYAAKGFAAWNAPVTVAENLTFDSWLDVEGFSLPVDSRNLNFLTSEPFFLALMEVGSHTPEFQRLAALVYEVQKKRWQRTGILTAVSEDAMARYPWFVYNSIVFGDEAWQCVDRNGFKRDGLRSFSTKAGWAWSALILDSYAQELGNKAETLSRQNFGFFSGEFESGVPNESFNINTNAVVLASLCALVRGAKPFLPMRETP